MEGKGMEGNGREEIREGEYLSYLCEGEIE